MHLPASPRSQHATALTNCPSSGTHGSQAPWVGPDVIGHGLNLFARKVGVVFQNGIHPLPDCLRGNQVRRHVICAAQHRFGSTLLRIGLG